MLVNSSSQLHSAQFHSQSRLAKPEPTAQSKQQAPDDKARSGEAGKADKSAESENQLAEQRELQKLKNVDRDVRAHELAHISVGGRYVTSGARFDYQRGPDGRQYAVSGEVSIDTSEVAGDPQATLQKAQVILRAALAPADPSAQDRRVAAQAVSTMQQARLALSLQEESGVESQLGNRVDAFA